MPSIQPLATISPSSQSRTWQTRPHPTLPLLATACADKTVRISNLSTFQHLSTVSGGHKRSVRSVAWKPSSGPRLQRRKRLDGSTEEIKGLGESVLYTGSFDASAGVWRRWESGSGVVDMNGDADGEAQERDFTDGGKGEGEDEEWQFAVVLDGHDSEIKSVAYSHTGPFLATCGRDKSVWIWEELEDDNYETVAVLQEHEGDVKCVAWHPEEIMVASASYDDSVRLWREEGEGEDWGCAAVIEGFGGTVWGVEFEPSERVGRIRGQDGHAAQREGWTEARKKSGPRLLTCSDDLSIRLFRRTPKEKADMPTGRGKMPSILKTTSIEEEWLEEARLPKVHERPVYSTSWSSKSGRIVSSGSDGRLVVYEERWKGEGKDVDGSSSTSATEWVVIAEYENAHDVFEVNHVTWALRADKGKREDDEEVVVSTGDDGEVKIWTIEP